jgi:2-iminobutanoate/2-iminopropanoate deaminase
VAAPIGPYTPVVRAGDFIICSGQLGLASGSLVDGGVAAQVSQAIRNLASLLAGEGADLGDVVKTLVLLADMSDFGTMNAAYMEAFGDHRPARSCFAVAGLPLGALVEVEAWAYKPLAGAE